VPTRSQRMGSAGEREVADTVQCPHCGRDLRTAPVNHPLYDIECVHCEFRAQVKTSPRAPGGAIFGAGWDIVEKVLRAGYMLPPLIVNYKWLKSGRKTQQIIFYPLITRKSLKRYRLKKGNRAMFIYVGLSGLPQMELEPRTRTD
jgi:DNA-directed RNA polymerase subunit RPC12/RpoP